MQIDIPVETYKIKYYDITLASGVGMSASINEALGDAVTEGPDKLEVYLSPKPILANPKEFMPAEHMTIYMRHVVAIQWREKEVTQITPEQQFQLNQTIQEMTSKAIH